MSTAATRPAGALAGGAPGAPPEWAERAARGEACPLCGGPLERTQDWCLACGAAARTRLAALPNWRAPVIATVAAIVLFLGILSAALVKLAAGSEPAPAPITTVTSTAPAAPGTHAAHGAEESATNTSPGSR